MGKQRTITMTNRRPITIDEDEWPLIAHVTDDNYGGEPGNAAMQQEQAGQYDEWSLRVRRDNDGRVIVYGYYTEAERGGSGHQGLGHAGELLHNPPVGFVGDDAIIAAIHDVGRTLGVPAQTVADCIAALPAEQI